VAVRVANEKLNSRKCPRFREGIFVFCASAPETQKPIHTSRIRLREIF
jgi:hypothetical protein